MSYKPDEATLISYLYGELEHEERKMVEAYLEKNPEERRRIEDWGFTRMAMGRLPDKEVIAPPIILGDDVPHAKLVPFWKQSYFRMPVGMAASLFAVMLAAKLLGLSIGYSGNELRISFGTPLPSTQPQALTEQRVGEMINQSLANNNQVLQASWGEDRKVLEASIQKNLNTSSQKINQLMKTASVANEREVRGFVSQMQNDNLKLLKDYMQLSSAGQKEYIEGLLVDFAKYLQEQRNQDLAFFQTRMNTVEKNTDQLKAETEELLTSLVSSTSLNNQKRN